MTTSSLEGDSHDEDGLELPARGEALAESQSSESKPRRYKAVQVTVCSKYKLKSMVASPAVPSHSPDQQPLPEEMPILTRSVTPPTQNALLEMPSDSRNETPSTSSSTSAQMQEDLPSYGTRSNSPRSPVSAFSHAAGLLKELDSPGDDEQPNGLDQHKCPECGAGFAFRKSIYTHLRSTHLWNEARVELMKESYKKMRRVSRIRYTCPTCGQGFGTKFGLTVHNKTKHGIDEYKCGKNVVCPECGELFKTHRKLAEHCDESHRNCIRGQDYRVYTGNFPSWRLFEDWLHRMEIATASVLVKKGKKLLPLCAKRFTYGCQYSKKTGSKMPSEVLKRRRLYFPHMQSHCPAFVNAVLKSNGTVEYNAAFGHLGHAVRRAPIPVSFPVSVPVSDPISAPKNTVIACKLEEVEPQKPCQEEIVEAEFQKLQSIHARLIDVGERCHRGGMVEELRYMRASMEKILKHASTAMVAAPSSDRDPSAPMVLFYSPERETNDERDAETAVCMEVDER